MSNDLLPPEDDADSGLAHLQGDVFDAIDRCTGFDMLIFHAPCTYLTLSGVRWLYKGGRGTIIDPVRWKLMEEAAEFFRRLLNSKFYRIAGENPLMHRHASSRVGQKQTQIIQPWMFGTYETKATALWLKNLPQLKPKFRSADECREALGLSIGIKPHARIHLASPRVDRWKERSRTDLNIAAAMAEQWSAA